MRVQSAITRASILDGRDSLRVTFLLVALLNSTSDDKITLQTARRSTPAASDGAGARSLHRYATSARLSRQHDQSPPGDTAHVFRLPGCADAGCGMAQSAPMAAPSRPTSTPAAARCVRPRRSTILECHRLSSGRNHDRADGGAGLRLADLRDPKPKYPRPSRHQNIALSHSCTL